MHFEIYIAKLPSRYIGSTDIVPPILENVQNLANTVGCYSFKYISIIREGICFKIFFINSEVKLYIL